MSHLTGRAATVQSSQTAAAAAAAAAAVADQHLPEQLQSGCAVCPAADWAE